MSNLLIFIIFIISIFALLAVAIKFFPKDSIFTIAIGAVIGANIYNASTYPLDIFGIRFGFDSIIYTIFLFCMLVMYIDYGRRDLKIVLYTALFSIFFSAFLFVFGTYSQTGWTDGLWTSILSYLASIVGTFCAVWAMVALFGFLKERNLNIYVIVPLVLFFASLVNTIIYFGLTFVFSGQIVQDFLNMMAGSYIGKIIASLLCIALFGVHKIWQKQKNQDKTS